MVNLLDVTWLEVTITGIILFACFIFWACREVNNVYEHITEEVFTLEAGEEKVFSHLKWATLYNSEHSPSIYYCCKSDGGFNSEYKLLEANRAINIGFGEGVKLYIRNEGMYSSDFGITMCVEGIL